MEDRLNNDKNLVNYEFKSSNSNNYNSHQSSSTPYSFPELMENGILVQYKQTQYTSDLMDEKASIEKEPPHNN
jgi:hypothetical protein